MVWHRKRDVLALTAKAVPMKTLLSIQYLRALAAISVITVHSQMGFTIGQMGVDIFFVISGFLMWSVTAKPVTALSFLKHRLFRIVPIYWIATVVTIAIAWAPIHHGVAQHGSVIEAVKSLLFVPYLDTTDIPMVRPVLIQGWTLNYEMFFYGVFALTMVLPRSRRLVPLVAGLVGLSLVGLVMVPAQTNPILATYTSPLLLEFLAGVLIAELHAHGRLPGVKAAAAMIVAALGFVAWNIGCTDFYVFPGTYGPRLLMFGIPAALLVCGVVAFEARVGMPRIRSLKFLGDASYSIYLFHEFPIRLVEKVVHGPVSQTIAVTLAGVALGAVVYVVAERPLTRALQGTVTLLRAKSDTPYFEKVA